MAYVNGEFRGGAFTFHAPATLQYGTPEQARATELAALLAEAQRLINDVTTRANNRVLQEQQDRLQAIALAAAAKLTADAAAANKDAADQAAAAEQQAALIDQLMRQLAAAKSEHIIGLSLLATDAVTGGIPQQPIAGQQALADRELPSAPTLTVAEELTPIITSLEDDIAALVGGDSPEDIIIAQNKAQGEALAKLAFNQAASFEITRCRNIDTLIQLRRESEAACSAGRGPLAIADGTTDATGSPDDNGRGPSDTNAGAAGPSSPAEGDISTAAGDSSTADGDTGANDAEWQSSFDSFWH